MSGVIRGNRDGKKSIDRKIIYRKKREIEKYQKEWCYV